MNTLAASLVAAHVGSALGMTIAYYIIKRQLKR